MKLTYLILIISLTGTTHAAISLPDTERVPVPVPSKPRPAPPEDRPVKLVVAPPVTPLPARQPSRDCQIRFRNADTLHGQLIGITGDGQVEWRHPDTAEALQFSMQNVMQVIFPGPGSPNQGKALVTLTNGDTLRGELVELNHEMLRLGTTFAGQLKIRRAMVRRLQLSNNSGGILFAGLTSLEGWHGGPTSWQVREGVLTMDKSGAIRRDIGLPAACSVEFELEWDQFGMVMIGLYAKGQEAFGNDTGCRFEIMPGSVRAFNYGRPARLLGVLPTQRFAQPGKARVAIIADRLKKTLTFKLDGQPLKTLTECGDFAVDGNTALTIAVMGEAPVRLGQLLVREWTGASDPDRPTDGPSQDILHLANGDNVIGAVPSIQNGILSATTRVGALEIPVERVTEIDFNGKEAELARRLPGDLRATFSDGNRVTMALDTIDEKSMTGSSENFGKVKFSRDAFQELQLHIYDENFD